MITLSWISWPNAKKAHALVISNQRPWHTTICGIDFSVHELSEKQECKKCIQIINAHRRGGFTVQVKNTIAKDAA